MNNIKHSDYNVYSRVPIEEKGNKFESKEVKQHGYGHRHLQSLLIFFSFLVGYMIRAHLSVTIVAMTQRNDAFCNDTMNSNFTGVKTPNISEIAGKQDKNNGNFQNRNAKPDNFIHNNNFTNIYRTYDWPKSTQEIILSSFGFGCSIMTFPMSLVTQRWGGVMSLQIMCLTDGVVSLLVPWLAVLGGWRAMGISHMVQGLAEGGLLSGGQRLLAAWVPLCERGRLASYVYTGMTFGSVIAFQISGTLPELGGWPSTYWVIGGISLVMFVTLTLFGSDSPSVHRRITLEEKIFITAGRNTEVKTFRTPWRQILLSKHCWAAYVSHIGSILTYFFCFNQIPSYLHHVFGVNVRNSGFLSSLPYIANIVTSFGFGFLSDFCTNRKLITVKMARCVSNTIGCLSLSLCLLAVSFTENVVLTIIFFIIALAGHAALHTGMMINYIDLSPNYCGVLMSTGSTIMNICMLAVPVFVSHVITDMKNQFQWRIAFLTMAAISFATNVIYVMFMSVDVQPWDNYGCSRNDQEEARKQIITEK